MSTQSKSRSPDTAPPGKQELTCSPTEPPSSSIVRSHVAPTRVDEGDERYRLLLNHSGLAIAYWSLGGDLLLVNGSGASLLHASADALVGKNVCELFGAEAGATYRDRFRSAASSDAAQTYEDHVDLPEGEFWFLTTFARVVGDDGTLLGVQTTSHEISERKRMEEALRESALVLNEAQEIANLGSFLWDLGNDSISWSDNMYAIVGMDNRAEVNSMSAATQLIIHPSDREDVAHQIQQMLEQKWTWPMRFRVVRPDGTVRVVRSSSRFRYGAGGEPIQCIGIYVDITEACEAQAAQELMAIRTHQAQKRESLGVLAGGIAHDFNNILVPILGNATFVLDDLPEASPLRECVAEIADAARRAAELCDQIHAYTGQRPFQASPLDLNEVIASVLEALAVTKAENVTQVFEPMDGLPRVSGNRDQLSQVIHNIVVNAWEAVAGRGEISIRTTVRHYNQEQLATMSGGDDVRPGRFVAVSVTDSGIGMVEALQRKVFDPFFSTKFTGRGLGLAVALGIVRAHQGAIRVDSQAGTGSTFEVLIPASGRAEEGVPGPSEAPATPRVIVVADDEPLVRSLVRRVLERAGHTVHLANDGREAVDQVSRLGDAVACVILDLTMPEMDGAQAFVEMRALRPDLPVVVTSGRDQEWVTSRFPPDARCTFVKKPFTPHALMHAVRKLLA